MRGWTIEVAVYVESKSEPFASPNVSARRKTSWKLTLKRSPRHEASNTSIFLVYYMQICLFTIFFSSSRNISTTNVLSMAKQCWAYVRSVWVTWITVQIVAYVSQPTPKTEKAWLSVFSFKSTGVVVRACKARNKRRYHRIQFGNKPIEDQIISGSSPAGKNWRRPIASRGNRTAPPPQPVTNTNFPYRDKRAVSHSCRF